MKVVTIATQKGGVGKTTTAWSLGTSLHKRGYSVLLIDADPQSNLAFTAGVDLLNLGVSLYDVFKNHATINESQIELKPGLRIAVGSIDLASADREFTGAKSLYLMRDALYNLDKKFDYVIQDTPPHLGVMMESALTASDEVIVPLKPDAYGLQGAGQLASFIDEVIEYTNPKLKVSGILLTQVNEKTNVTRAVLNNICYVADRLHTRVFDTRIRTGTAVPESVLKQTSLIDGYAKAKVTQDYEAFTDEFLKGAEE